MSNNKKRFSVKKKMYIFVVATVLAAVIGTSATAFIVSSGRINEYYRQNAADNARNFATMVDGDFLAQLRTAAESEEYQQIRDKAEEEEDEQPVEDFLKEKGLWDKYSEIRTKITNYVNNMDGIKYLYIIAHGDKDAEKDMYLLDDESFEIYETGYYEDREEELLGLDITNLKEPTISNGDWGWLCSAFKPVYASDGSIPCVVGCDFGMDDVMDERFQLLLYLIIGSLVFTAAVLTGAMIFMNKIIVRPLGAMTREMKKFKPAEHLSYKEAGVMDLNIKSRDEISEIYQGIRSMEINIIDYFNDLSVILEEKLKAESAVKDKDLQIGQLSLETYRDALTGVGNKTAYYKKIEELNAQLTAGEAEFAIVMIDLNDLKKINDQHGHRAGDLYIKGCCRMVCEAFKHSPVFRIGGDEFVAILHGPDFESRHEIFDKLRADLELSAVRTDIDPWLRCSAAIGMAENAFDDPSVDLVFKRADKAMYEDKIRFKRDHKSYRPTS